MKPSIDDAAALLIQIEPDDVSELDRLSEMLGHLAADPSYAPDCLTKLKAAEEMIRRIIADGDGGDDGFEAAGRLLEEAIYAQHAEDMIAPPGAQQGPPEAADAGAPAEDPPEEPAAPEEEAAAPEPEAPDERDAPDAPEETAAPPAAKGPPREGDVHIPESADPELISAFMIESNELIAGAEEALLSLETDPDDMESVGVVFRAFHTVKGTSAFLELGFVSEMAHKAESFLSRIREGEIRYAGGYTDLALRSIDMLKELMGILQAAAPGEAAAKPEGYDDLLEILAGPESYGITDEEIEKPVLPPRIGDILVAQGKADREMVERLAAAQDDRPMGARIIESKTASLKDVAQGLRSQKQMGPKKKMAESTVRVPVDRLDRFVDMVGELVVAHSMVAQDEIVAGGGHHELFKKVNQTSKIVRELQHMSMSMRMIPLKGTFQKMARLVRDLARKVGKNIKFVTEGEDTEIDRNMVDSINDPLVHMVRNAVDHGVESPEKRLEAGKPKAGVVKLSAYHSAGNVVVEIRDDGRGLDRDVILAKARERSLVKDGHAMDDHEIFNLIFEPGFSTAKIISDVSGRGVGMDVVKKNIDALRGHVDINSAPGAGCVFRMSLPLTLAIIDGMVVRVGRQKYVIPTVSIVRSVQPRSEDLSTVLRRGEMISLQGKLIPVFRMARLFRIEEAETDPTKALVVIVEDGGNQAGLLIDELIGTQQIVIKTLGEAMKNIPGISGSAIMPNGRVGLILDVGGLVRLANSDKRDGVRGEERRRDMN